MTKPLKILLLLYSTIFLSTAAIAQDDDDIAVVPGAQYVLRNVATGSYLMKDGTTTKNVAEASGWRVVTNDTVRYSDTEQLYVIYCDDAVMQLTNNGGGWNAEFSGKDNTTYVMPSTTTEKTFKFRYRFAFDTRYLNVEADAEGNEKLTAAHTASAYNDWKFVPATQPKNYNYRITKMERSSGYSSYNIAYRSTDPKGKEIWLSGYLAVPTKNEGGECTADHFLFSTHYTMCKRTQWPTSDTPIDAYSNYLSSNRPIMVEPDYLGCGITEHLDHLYCAAEPMAEESVDMLFATHELLGDLHRMDCYTEPLPTYGIGSSQGASIILACQKYVETSPKLSEKQRNTINWVRTNACAGLYDPLATLSHYYYVDKIDVPAVMPLLLLGQVAGFPEIFGETKAEEYFSEAFLQAGVLDMIRSHDYDSEEISNVIINKCGNTMHQMLSEEAQDPNSDISQKLQKSLGMCNLTRDWAPKADIKLHYFIEDEVVPHLNLVSATKGLKDKCIGKFETAKTTLGGRHIVACVNFFINILSGGYKE